MKKNKNLLQEGTIRRFMKLANIDTLSNTFMEGYDAYGIEEEEDPMEDPMEEPAMDMGDEMPAEEPAMDMEMGAEEPEMAPEVDEEVVNDIVDTMMTALSDKYPNLDIEVDSSPDVGEEAPEMDLDAEEPAVDMGDEMEAGDDEEVDLGAEEDALEEVEVVDDEAIVQEVYKRVAQRLVKAIKK